MYNGAGRGYFKGSGGERMTKIEEEKEAVKTRPLQIGKTNNLRLQAELLIAEIKERRAELIDRAIKSYMEAKELTLDDLMVKGEVRQGDGGKDSWYWYDGELVIHIQVVFSKGEVNLKFKSNYLDDQSVGLSEPPPPASTGEKPN